MKCTPGGGYYPAGFRAFNFLAKASLLAVGLGLTGCATVPGLLGNSKRVAPAVTENQVPEVSTARTTVKVALLLPLSARGQAGQIAQGLKEAGELALFDTNSAGIVLIPKDTRGTAAGAQAAARAAVEEGAELILGPLFSGSVKAVSPVARAANIPVMAFSTDKTVAGNGVYLLSFLPGQEVKRVVEYAASRGATNFGAILPNTAYGTLVEQAMVNNVPRNGGKMVKVARYGRSSSGLDAPVNQIAAATDKSGINAVMVSEGGNLIRRIAPALRKTGVSAPRVQLIGTGLWDESGIGAVPGLEGGWFAGPAPGPKDSFVRRYKSAYGRQPPRLASLAYDSVSLAINMSREPSGARFTPARITNPEGFTGVDGLFRFLPNGLNQRGLAVLEITAAGSRVVSPSPNRFTGAGY